MMKFIQTNDQINFCKYCTSANSGSIDSVDNMRWLTLSLISNPFPTRSVREYNKISANCSIYINLLTHILFDLQYIIYNFPENLLTENVLQRSITTYCSEKKPCS